MVQRLIRRPWTSGGGEEVYPGWRLGGYLEGLYRVLYPASQIETYLRYIKINWFIRPFDWLFDELLLDLRYWDLGPGSGPGSESWI